MSQITFTGPASGTGTVNISAPVTNTERNLTLPDMSGTITAASSGTADATTFLRGDGAWATAGSPPGTVDLLQEDTFTSSGTWTKAAGFDADDTVMVFLVGGGGSGGAAYITTDQGASAGGSGGQCILLCTRYADAPASASLTVGAGGAAITQSSAGATYGNVGSATNFESSPAGEFKVVASGGWEGSSSTDSVEVVCYPGTPPSGSTITNRLSLFTPGQIPQMSANTPANIQANSAAAGVISMSKTSNRGAASNSNVAAADYTPFAGQIFGGGGSAARNAATNQTVWNAKVAALFNTGGNGSGTTNGQSGGIGGGGGGCVRENATAVSGAGGNGGMVVRYYSGRVSPFQVLGAIGV